MIWLGLYLAVGVVNVAQALWTRKITTLRVADCVLETAFYLLAWPVQVIYPIVMHSRNQIERMRRH